MLQFPEYSFKVFPVHNCPMNKEAWDMSSNRLKCNRTHGYHCVPNSQLTSLVEFCYPRGRTILFQEGIVDNWMNNVKKNEISMLTIYNFYSLLCDITLEYCLFRLVITTYQIVFGFFCHSIVILLSWIHSFLYISP